MIFNAQKKTSSEFHLKFYLRMNGVLDKKGWMLEVVFLWNPFFCYGEKIKQNWNLCFIAWWSKERRGHKKMLSIRQTKPMTMMNQNGRNRRNKCVSHFVYGNAPPTVRCRFFGLGTHGNIIFFCAFNETKCVRKWCRRESPSNKKKNNMTVCSLCGMLLFRMKKKEYILEIG